MPGLCSLTHGFGSRLDGLTRRRDALDAAADRGLGPFVDDLVGRQRDGLQARRAEAVDRRRRRRVTGSPARIAATRATLSPCEPCGMAQPRIDVLDLGRIELRHLPQHVA